MDGIKYIYCDKSVFMGEPIKEKKAIIQYFEKFKPNFATSAFVMDYIKHKKVDGHYNVGYEYDGFYWNEEDIYHFKKYDMPLNQEFIENVLSKTK